MKDHLRKINEERGNPEKAYSDEMNERNSNAMDTNAESDARDLAKVSKSIEGTNQKMDSVHPDDMQNDEDDNALKETEELK